MNNINLAYQWAINACNAPSIGYSQLYRTGRTINGITYYDCSSFLSKALTVGGFFDNNPWFTTRNMRELLIGCGFNKVNVNSLWYPGDILWRQTHTEMVYVGKRTMGAHNSSRPLKDQVSINDYDSSADSWSELYRFGTGANTSYDWIKGNYYLSENEMKNNAYIVYSVLFYKGWSVQAIAGLLGNMESESTINPAIWQNLNPNPYFGYGLVQWTPSTNYTNWANEHGYSIVDGDYQLLWIDEETEKSGQWIPTSDYPLSFSEFKVSTDSAENLASAFLKNFERAGIEVESTRRQNALKWFNYIKDLSPWLPINTSRRKTLPVWMMC